MPMKRKRAFALTLALAMALGMSSFTAFAAEENPEGGVTGQAAEQSIVVSEATMQEDEPIVTLQEDEPEITIQEDAPKAERTILLYDCGADLETAGAMATYNLKQVLRANFSKDEKVRFIVMTGGSLTWHMDGDKLFDPATGKNMKAIPTEYNQIWEAKGADAAEHPGQMVLLDGDGVLGDGPDAKPALAETVYNPDTYSFDLVRDGELKTPDDYEWMFDPDVLRAFINYGVANYPAEKYDLILWDHGGGPTGGYAYDENSESSNMMSMVDIMNALKDNDLVKNGGKFDFVDFDACLMSSVEYVYGLSDCMDYYIASPEVEPGYGQDYEGWLNALGETPNMDTFELGKKIVDDYIAFYNKEEGNGAGNDGTLAVYNMEKLLNNPVAGQASLLDDLITLNGILKNELEQGTYYDEARSISQVMHYGGLNFVDLGQLVSQLGYTLWEADKNNLTGDDNIDTRNAYTEVAAHIQLILQDEEVIYSRGTKNMRTDPWFYRGINGLSYGDQGTSGIYLFMPGFDDTFEADDYTDLMEQYIELLPPGDIRATFFDDYLDTVSRLVLIHSVANEITELIDKGTPKADITYDVVKQAAQGEEGEDSYAWSSLFKPWIVKLGGEDAIRPWLEMIVQKQAASALVLSNVSVESTATDGGTAHKVTIKDADKQMLDSVGYSVGAELPAVQAFLDRPDMATLKPFFTGPQTSLTLGTVKGTLETGFEETEYKKAVEWLADKNSEWSIGEFEHKWYALRDSEGNLHVTSPISVDADAAIIPVTYETTAFAWDYSDGEGTYEAYTRFNLVYLFLEDGCTKLTEIGFLEQGGGLRVIDASQFRGALEVTPVMPIYFLGAFEIDVPISMTSFTLTPESIENGSFSLEYTDIDNISDIADVDGDGQTLSIRAVVNDIYGGSLDISNLVFEPIEPAEVTGIKNQTYTGKAITQNPVVKMGNKVLVKGRDYKVAYKNNKNAGTATIIITGIGNYRGSITKTFQIGKAASAISIPAKTTTFNGKVVNYKASAATVKGSSGKITFKYYSDAKCTKTVKASAVKNAGTYYVKATVAANANYQNATSKTAKLTIKRANNTFKIKSTTRTIQAGKTKPSVKVVKKGTGSKTYKIKSVNKKKYAKYFKINKKTGKITVNKKTPAGKYVVTVSAKAATTKNYKASAWKTAKVTINVKAQAKAK